MQTKIDFIAIVNDLNDELYSTRKTESSFSYLTDGYVDIVRFNEHCLWCSEMDERVWVEAENDYEPFGPFIRREFNEYVDKLRTFRFKRVPQKPIEPDDDE
jgi:hypothetical protein